MTEMNPVDLLVIGAHPDDQELSVGGTMLKHKALGWTIGILDLTMGEMGTRGTPEKRRQEALKAADFVGASWRIPLDLKDGFLRSDKEAQLEVIRVIRAASPRLILCNAIHDRHTDHRKGSDLVDQASFLSGLKMIETRYKGKVQEAYRAKAVYHYIQDYYVKPDFVIDISEYIDQKMELIMCYDSQFYNPNDPTPNTPISGKDFLEFLRGRAADMGRPLGVKYGEGFTTSRYLGLEDFSKVL